MVADTPQELCPFKIGKSATLMVLDKNLSLLLLCNTT